MNKVRKNVIGTIFRKIEKTLRADDRLKPAIRDWKTFGDQDRASPTGPAKGVINITLFPLIVGQARESEASDEVTLAVQCEFTFDTTNACDWTDLWFAIQEALWPPDLTTQLALHAELREAGAITGQPSFAAPEPLGLITDMAANGQFTIIGQILLAVRKSLIN